MGIYKLSGRPVLSDKYKIKIMKTKGFWPKSKLGKTVMIVALVYLAIGLIRYGQNKIALSSGDARVANFAVDEGPNDEIYSWNNIFTWGWTDSFWGAGNLIEGTTRGRFNGGNWSEGTDYSIPE